MRKPSTGLLELVKEEALRRGLLAAKETLDAARAFVLVRDMPYRRASSWDPRVTLQEWCGSCSGKHYLVLHLPQGDMIVDAAWTTSLQSLEFTVNEAFVLGQSQAIACEPIRRWLVSPDRDPQAFKDQLLRTHFTPDELAQREAILGFFMKNLS